MIKIVNKEDIRDLIVRFFPMLIVQLYLFFTVFIFAFGPWPWPVSNPFILYTFLAITQMSLLLGYLLSMYSKPTMYVGRWSWKQLFNFSLVLSILWIIPNFMTRMGLSSLDMDEIYQKLMIGFIEPADVYMARLKLEAEISSSSFFTYLSIIVNPILQLLLPIGIVFWTKLSTSIKILFVLVIITGIFSWIASGTNKGIADLLFLVPFYFFASNPRLITKFKLKHALLMFCILIICFSGFFTFFSMGMSERANSATMNKSDYSIGIPYDESNLILNIFPEELQGGVASFCSYLSQGYYGLSLSLEEPFIWTYGIGHSYYLPSWFRYIDPDSNIGQLSYPGRVESNPNNHWSYFERWHSIYPWLASDLTFPGVIIFMFFIGRLFSLVWQDILYCKNPIAISLFGSLLIMLFYVSANNQILCFPQSAFAFFVLLVWWLVTRRRKVSRLKHCG